MKLASFGLSGGRRLSAQIFACKIYSRRQVFMQSPPIDETPGKEISIVNYPSRDGVGEDRRTVQFGHEAGLFAFMARHGVSALEEVHPSGKGKLVTTLADIDPKKEYIMYYTKFATESRLISIEGFTRNSAGAFEDRANIAVVNQLRHRNHAGVELLNSKVKLRWGKKVKGDIDGLVVTDTHIFVVEAKMHAVPEDTAQCVNNVALLLDPKTSPVLVNQDDPRKCNIVGVLATTSVPDTALLNAARAAGVWLLSPDGSELRLLNPSDEFEQERGSI